MNALSGKELAKVLELYGWQLLRILGSHHIYGKPGSVVRLSVPIHGNKTLKIGLQKHLLKVAGLEERDLESAPTTGSRSHTRSHPEHGS